MSNVNASERLKGKSTFTVTDGCLRDNHPRDTILIWVVLLVIVTIIPNYGKHYRLHYWVSIYGAASTTGNNKKKKKAYSTFFFNIQIHAYILIHTYIHICT